MFWCLGGGHVVVSDWWSCCRDWVMAVLWCLTGDHVVVPGWFY